VKLGGFLNDLARLGRGAVAGARLGGFPGAIVGTAAVVVDQGLKDLIDDWLKPGKSKGSAAIPAALLYRPGLEDAGLRTDGRQYIDTGRYLISVKEGEVKIYDKKTRTWVRAWGDPHLHTSDGDKAQFQKNNLTIDLEDGTKITIKVTEPNRNGVSRIDAVAVMKGSQAVVVEGLSDGKPGVKVGNVLNNADAVDAAWDDGTVLRAGHAVDDLTFAATGEEIVGTDPKSRFGEHMLDGKGGVSANGPDFRTQSADDPDTAGGADRADGPQNADGPQQADGVDAPHRPRSLLAMFLQVLEMLESSLRDRLETIEKKAAQRKHLENQLKDIDTKLAKAEGGQAEGLKKQRDALVDEMESKGLTEAALRNAMMEAQAIQNFINQVTSMATSIQRSRHQTLMNIARNMGG